MCVVEVVASVALAAFRKTRNKRQAPLSTPTFALLPNTNRASTDLVEPPTKRGAVKIAGMLMFWWKFRGRWQRNAHKSSAGEKFYKQSAIDEYSYLFPHLLSRYCLAGSTLRVIEAELEPLDQSAGKGSTTLLGSERFRSSDPSNHLFLKLKSIH